MWFGMLHTLDGVVGCQLDKHRVVLVLEANTVHVGAHMVCASEKASALDAMRVVPNAPAEWGQN
jgi:hypothetical protein